MTPPDHQPQLGARRFDGPRRPARAWVAWVAPDLALTLAAVTLLYCLFVFGASTRLFRDSDTGWHIRNGERIAAGLGIPRRDPYSLTRNGQPWFAWEWGADLLMGWIHQRAGMPGVALLYTSVIAGATWLWLRLHWVAGGNFLFACGMLPLMISTASLHWLARPHLFGWIFLLGTLWTAERAPIRFRAWHAVLVMSLSALWANMHGSFFLGPLVLALYAAGLAVRPYIWRTDYFLDAQRARWLLWAVACAAAGSFLNPYGWRLHAHVGSYLFDRELLTRVAEYQTFNFHSAGSLPVVAALCLCAAGTVAALFGRQPARFFVGALFALLALRSERGLPLAALAVMPLANGSLTAALATWRGLRDPARRALDEFLTYGTRLRAVDRRFHGAALVPQLLLLAWLSLLLPATRAQTGFSAGEFPVVSSSAIGYLPASARVFATDKFGGYLIYRFEGQRKVFCDGRSDLYGSDFLRDYVRIVEARPGWQELWNRYGFTHALVPRDASLVAALAAAGWRRLRDDSVAVLLEAPQSQLR